MGNLSGYVAPQIMGVMHDATGGYMIPILVAGAVTLMAPVLILLSGIRRYVQLPASR